MSHFRTCINCGSSETTMVIVEEHMIDGIWTPMCDDCMAEEERIEDLAGELVRQPSCFLRQQIVDGTMSTRALVNALKAHDMAECVHCSSTRKPAQTDRPCVDRKSDVA